MLVCGHRPPEVAAMKVTVALLGLLASTVVLGAGPTPVQGLPDRLTAQEYWRLTVALSEPSAAFISDNLVSNEMSFAQVVPQLVAATRPGGVYLGVGPEQNFTFIAAMKARMAFILDIRRDNLLLHLLYKALFALSPDRASFVGRLFTRHRADGRGPTESVVELMDDIARTAPGSDEEFRRNLRDVESTLAGRYRFPLSADDRRGIERLYESFHRFGPEITYATPSGRPFGRATYRNLMKQVDGRGTPLGYLATEESYRYVRDLHARHLIVPVVGNFAGATALRSIGGYVKASGAVVAAFYLSNVEEYLGLEPTVPRNGDWNVFCANVAALPRDDRSVFVRPFGVATYEPDGTFLLSRSIRIGSAPDAAVFAAGVTPVLPAAISLIGPEVRACAGRGH
jgi:hypothetical protein